MMWVNTQVVRLLLRGHTARSTAERLGIVESTAAIHRKRAYAKLGVNSQSELFYLFIRALKAVTSDIEVDPLAGFRRLTLTQASVSGGDDAEDRQTPAS
jgi:DNA-binding CsgD family transcriptional regulator